MASPISICLVALGMLVITCHSMGPAADGACKSPDLAEVCLTAYAEWNLPMKYFDGAAAVCSSFAEIRTEMENCLANLQCTDYISPKYVTGEVLADFVEKVLKKMLCETTTDCSSNHVYTCLKPIFDVHDPPITVETDAAKSVEFADMVKGYLYANQPAMCDAKATGFDYPAMSACVNKALEDGITGGCLDGIPGASIKTTIDILQPFAYGTQDETRLKESICNDCEDFLAREQKLATDCFKPFFLKLKAVSDWIVFFEKPFCDAIDTLFDCNKEVSAGCPLLERDLSKEGGLQSLRDIKCPYIVGSGSVKNASGYALLVSLLLAAVAIIGL